MAQEEKQLLLKDLCTRLPYGVIVDYAYNTFKNGLKEGKLTILTCNILSTFISPRMNETNEYIKPYLRPMSSMTEEEFKKLKEYSGLKYEQLDLASFQNGTYKCLDFYLSEVPSYVVILVFDWLNKHHFDYRGLIERGLAIEAPDDMYKIK
jgi:hypothetical protein